MKPYIITSTPNKGLTFTRTKVEAKSFTMALLGASLKLPESEEIISIVEVTK